MTSQKRRAAGRRRAWGRGPIILRFERLEGRQLLTTPPQPLPDLVGADFATAHNLSWGNSFEAIGTILNQGDATTTSPFNVTVYAATATTISTSSVPLGVVTIPAGLAPHQTFQFDQTFALPATPIPSYSSGNPIYIDLFLNANKAVTESNYKNDEGIGQGFDSSPIVIVPEQPSLLVGSSFQVTPSPTAWGQTITVTAQIRNNAQGDAAATRAKLVLTPSGLNPGSAYDYTVGYLNIPAIPAWQTVNVQQQITLPASPPSSLASNTQFTLSMAQDADFVTDPLYPHVATQGQGLDSIPITVNANPSATSSTASGSSSTPVALPDVAPSNVVVTSKSVYWGYNFQVTSTFQNLGQAAAGPVEVIYLLTGTGGSIANGVFLGEATLPALAQGATQVLNQTVRLPNQLPNGESIPADSLGRIAVLVDPDHTVDMTPRSNSLAESAPLTLRVLGMDGSSTVPTSPPVGTTLGNLQAAGTVQSTASTSTTAPVAAAVPASAKAKAARQGHTTVKLHRAAKPKHESITSRIEHQLKVFPDNVKTFLNNVVGNSTKPKAKPKKKAK